MIKIISLTNKKYEFFQNYHELCEHINRTERFTALGTGKTPWKFSRCNYEALSFFYSRCPKSFEEVCTSEEKEALEKGLGLVEILKGDTNCLTQILCTSDLDILSLKKDWCLDYCREYGYTVLECDGSINLKKAVKLQ